ncbi:MAG: response regulator [Methylobacter sp.]|nr:MAG: response regulator [Methylobacter sp.]
MPIILIATDNAEDAKVVKQQLDNEYENIFISTNPDQAAQDFDTYRPDVLVLAFNVLEKAERYYLGLFRISSVVHTHPHRTLILCNKDELRRVYELCQKDYFDDYILFWPTTHDFTRLAMAVYHAMQDLTALKADPSAVELAAQARRLAGLEYMLDRNLTEGSERVEAISHSIACVEQDVKVTLDGFSERLSQGDFSNLVEVKDAKGLQHEIGLLQQGAIHGSFHSAVESIEPLKTWAQTFQKECASHLESARALKTMVEKMPGTIMVVDDDDLMRKAFRTVLVEENYELMFAVGGIEALSLLRKRRPDLILMDMMMPGIDGLETIRRIKSDEQFSTIPIIMVTGNSEKTVVTNCLKAGAAGFVVKPFNRKTLLDKIRKFLY